MSVSSTSPMEQGELEASPDLLHSPHILLDLGESDPNADFLTVGSRAGEQSKGGREDTRAMSVSSPERHEDVEDVLIIQPPQLQLQARKEKHRRRHKDGRKKGKEDRYDEDPTERHSSRKTDRLTDKFDDKFMSKQMKRDEEREIEEHRRKKSLQERERLERLEMERRRLERERERKYLEQQERAAKEEMERKQALREDLERRQAAREKERARQGKLRTEGDRRNEHGGRNRREDDTKRLAPDVGKERRPNREPGFSVVPVRRPRSRSRSPMIRSEFEMRERDHSREIQSRNMQRVLQRESVRDARREAVKGTAKELHRDSSRETLKDLPREAAVKDSRRDAERDSNASSRWNEDRQQNTQVTTSDEEAGSQGSPLPVPKSKVSSRRTAEGYSAEAVSSEESDRSDPSGSPLREIEPDHQRRPSHEVESDKSDAESEASGKSNSSSSSGSSGSNSEHSDQNSPTLPAHNIRSKFDDTVNDEHVAISPRSSRSTRSSSHSSQSDDNYEENDYERASVSPVPSPVSMEPVLPNYYPAYQGCRNVEEFHCLNRIEEGTYGVVYRARDLKTNEIVALKRLKMEKEKEGFPITSLREINTLLKSQHENIVTVREIVVGSNMDKIYIVMDYVEHDLKSLMEIMKEPFSIGEVKTLLRQLLKGVRHLHDNWIIHRDLKTSNLLLSHKGILKIGDFGLAREYGSPLKNYTPIVVTLWYRSPELLLGTKLYSCPIDMWSVGCIFAEFLTRKPLFPGKSEIDELNRIFKELGTPTEKIWPGVGELPAMKKCTFTEYPYNQLRTRFGSLLSDKGFELLNKFLTYNPDRRITATEAVRHDYFDEMPKPTDPSMFPTWPPKSEQSRSRTHGNSPKPPSGGKAYAKLLGDDDELGSGFHLAAPVGGVSSAGAGFALKF